LLAIDTLLQVCRIAVALDCDGEKRGTDLVEVCRRQFDGRAVSALLSP
jgi:hypothetical protein